MYTLNTLIDEYKIVSDYTRYMCDEYTELVNLKHAVAKQGMTEQLNNFAQVFSATYKKYNQTTEGTSRSLLLMSNKNCVAAIEGMIQDAWNWIVKKWHEFINFIKQFLEKFSTKKKAETDTIDTLLSKLDSCKDELDKSVTERISSNVISDISDAMLDRMSKIIEMQATRGDNLLSKIENAQSADDLKNEKQDEYHQNYFKISDSYKEFRYASEYHKKDTILKLLNNLKNKVASMGIWEKKFTEAQQVAEKSLKEAQAANGDENVKNLLVEKVRVFNEYITKYLTKAVKQFITSVEEVLVPCKIFVKYASNGA